MKMEQILISEVAHNSDEYYTVVNSNSRIINFLLAQKVSLDKIHPDALTAYYVDYYFSQVNMAGFSKFMHDSQWNKEINDKIEYGLRAIKSFKHLEFFLNKQKEIKEISSDELERYLENHYDIDDPIREALDEDKSFYRIDDDIVDLNGAWLKEHKDANVLSMDEIFVILEKITGKPIQQ
ncbi:MAG: Unknown protein [uncultured Sulfurovum sp.]|uniref:DNA mimic protein DMP19 C-terminal domain-containing protein n=1 Tax=uncultured Sulfurovum sp. TaxID=269237 RepID=A0A6S6TFY0_9BACT|nr:MAG: Unknown protein [uncultured Sulfurovum sp.]